MVLSNSSPTTAFAVDASYSCQLLLQGRRASHAHSLGVYGRRRDVQPTTPRQLLLPSPSASMDDAVTCSSTAEPASDEVSRLRLLLQEKEAFSHDLHLQLDSQIERNDQLSSQLQEKAEDIAKALALLQEKEPLAAQLQESEAKNAKLKQLALKLKKELAEAREEVGGFLLELHI